eukprot:4305079-Amphidinium_carterae.1
MRMQIQMACAPGISRESSLCALHRVNTRSFLHIETMSHTQRDTLAIRCVIWLQPFTFDAEHACAHIRNILKDLRDFNSQDLQRRLLQCVRIARVLVCVKRFHASVQPAPIAFCHSKCCAE